MNGIEVLNILKKLTSKEYLELSALELLSSQGIDKVTVKDICSNCNLSTHTFYKYYRDKYDIINTCFNSKLEQFYTLYDPNINIRNFLLFTAQIVNEHLDFWENVFRYTGQNNVRLSLVKPLSEHYLRIIHDYCGAEITQPIKDAVKFYVQGQLSYVEEALTRTNIPGTKASVDYFVNAIPVLLYPYL